jgi:hypothetical protein
MDDYDDEHDVELDGEDDAELLLLSEDADELRNPSTAAGWTIIPLTDKPTTVEFNAVDTLLLSKAREEIPVVLKRVLAELRPRRTMEAIDSLMGANVGELTKLFFQNTLLRVMLTRINKGLCALGHSALDDGEFFDFLNVELLLSHYNISPEVFYDVDLRSLYPAAGLGMKQSRYREILASLKLSDREMNDRLNPDTDEWEAPYSVDPTIPALHAELREINRKLAFVKGVTVVCLDDHHERLKSIKCKDSGFTHIYNPEKALGPVMHSQVSVITGLFLGGYVQTLDDTTDDCTKELVRGLYGRDLNERTVVKLEGTHYDVDRGYSGIQAYKTLSKYSVTVTR